MTTPSNYSDRHLSEESALIPEDLRAVAHSIDRLAATDAAAASTSLETRLFDASYAVIASNGVDSPAVIHASMFRIAPRSLRVAAGVAITLAGATLAGWLALRTHPTSIIGTSALAERPAQLQQDLESWLAEASALDAGSSPDLTALNSELAALAESASFLPPIDDTLLEEAL